MVHQTPEETSIFIITYGVGKQYALSNMILMEFRLGTWAAFKDFQRWNLPMKLKNWADKNRRGLKTRHHSLISVVLGFSLAL